MIVSILQTRELRPRGLKSLAQGHVILQKEPPLPDSQASIHALFPITVFFSTYHPSRTRKSLTSSKQSYFLNSVISPSADLPWQ